MSRLRTGRRRAAVLAGIAGLVVALGAAEIALRLLPEREVPGRMYYRDAEGREAGREEALALGIVQPVDPSPRPRMGFAPRSHFFICYRDFEQPWFDEHGCVEVRFSSHGIREREEIGPDKPPGQKRVLCLGDSFTFGWGVRAEDCWVRLLEQELREEDDAIRTVNCGAAGTTVVDEYQWGLEHRFAKFQPDVVLVTLCLNDLLITDAGLAQTQDHRWHTPSVLVNRVAALFQPGPLDLDPGVDWVGLLLDLPADHPFYTKNAEVARDMLWPAGTPQRALRAIRDWCHARDVPLGVVVWPFLQGLEDGGFYPFTGMHERVVEFCSAEGIPCLDLLPTFRGHQPSTLWVTPADMHANPRAHRLATPVINRFVVEFSGLLSK